MPSLETGVDIQILNYSTGGILRTMHFPQRQVIATTREFVECESPSDDPAAVNRFVDLLAETIRDIARVKTYDGGKSRGRHLRCEFLLPGTKKSGQILALGHSDTVWPMGTLSSMPFKQARGRLWGPGVFDMKAGLVFFIFAMRALREQDIPVTRKVILQVNADEEVGSASSRPLTEEAARASAAVLVLEPSQGLDGKLKTARKGVGDYTVTVRGRAAHAGLDFLNGASAIIEMAKQVQKIAGFTRLNRGITVSPGVIRGGTRSNVIWADECWVEVDVRAPRSTDATYLERQFASLRPFDKRCASINVIGRHEPSTIGTHGGGAGALSESEGIGGGTGPGLGGIVGRRRVRRQLHGCPRRTHARRIGGHRGGGARYQRKHPDRSDGGSDCAFE